ncbi:uncharacterized protein LOC111800873 isoform X2 [Cucurbita pepo subsp. pepo]|uniref:uncharacterized protein LOC111800873 isoform X2 n=1 Tax=Cucurbita pepo subsp. pepo TaxID=3664 RepID=UPI000C9D6BD2|nr:uncharacterized protein LOC111800873 isoform X2 [Cucurbita pepo subsp. pepo]
MLLPFTIKFFDVRISKPCPHMRHLSDLTYGSFVNVITIYHKVVLIQEQLSKDRIIIDTDKRGSLEERKIFVQTYMGAKGPSDSEVEKLVQDVEKYTLASHLVWGLSGIISWVGYALSRDTPEGEACELVKNLALMTHVTTKAH